VRQGGFLTVIAALLFSGHGAIAQLGECLDRTQEAAGSSPASSISMTPSGPRVLLRSEDSEGAVSIIETSPSPGAGPALHRHDFDEAFYVIEGKLSFQVDEEVVEVGPGEMAFVPRGTPHTFANLSDAPARQLIVCTPAGFERYFARLAAEREGIEPPDWALQPVPEVTRLGPTLVERLDSDR
jgi:quercetin dioxygenase-like cupin family protein